MEWQVCEIVFLFSGIQRNFWPDFDFESSDKIHYDFKVNLRFLTIYQGLAPEAWRIDLHENPDMYLIQHKLCCVNKQQ